MVEELLDDVLASGAGSANDNDSERRRGRRHVSGDRFLLVLG
jgi:hypothetical protein